jgi:alkaline phosphatase
MVKGSTESQAGEGPEESKSATSRRFPWLRPGIVAVVLVFLAMSLAIAGLGWTVYRGYQVEPVPVARSGSSPTQALPPLAGDTPRNIILMIADGAGVNHYAAARLHKQGPEGRLAVDRMPVVGLINTHSANRIITDSAAAATAMASGVKTDNGLVGLDPAGKPLRSSFDDARSAGKATGIIVTSSVTDGTPAAFYAHTRERGLEDDIALALPTSGIDLVLGAGHQYFLPESKGGRRQDTRDVLAEMKANGYRIARTQQDFDREIAAPGKLLGLFRITSIAAGGEGPSLGDMLKASLQRLDSHSAGFVLMVEGSLIDDSSHIRDTAGTLAEMEAFDSAVAEALVYAAERGDTLVIVTSDHECGGLLIEDPMHGAIDGSLSLQWNTGLRRTSHTGGMVPLYAYGPGAARFAGTHDNTDIAKFMRAMLRSEPPRQP